MSALTLPGSIPGLLRRGSPVVLQTCAGPASGVFLGYPDYMRPDEWEIAWMPQGSETGAALDPLPLRALALDLADATGRAHAAWWLLAHLCPKPEPRVLPGWCAGWSEEDFGVWVLSGLGRVWSFTGHPEAENTLDADVEMRIAGLRFLVDARIPRLLPDSSRWVDAEALRRVVLDVAGVAP